MWLDTKNTPSLAKHWRGRVANITKCTYIYWSVQYCTFTLLVLVLVPVPVPVLVQVQQVQYCSVRYRTATSAALDV
jgi:hypothetical protein